MTYCTHASFLRYSLRFSGTYSPSLRFYLPSRFPLLQYSPYLRNYMNTIGTVAFAKVASNTNSAVDLFRKTWNIATGQEV